MKTVRLAITGMFLAYGVSSLGAGEISYKNPDYSGDPLEVPRKDRERNKCIRSDLYLHKKEDHVKELRDRWTGRPDLNSTFSTDISYQNAKKSMARGCIK